MEPAYCFQDSPFRKKLFSPLKAKGFVPQKHSQLYISGIPETATVHDLREYFEKVGQIFEIKLMTKEDNRLHNRGFGYITFMNSVLAQEALTSLKDELFMGEAPLSLSLSVDNCRIFVGGLPVEKTKDQIWNALQNAFNIQNVVDVITYRNYANPDHNRGFVFLEFRTHEEASYFRAKYSDKLVLFGKQLKVSWAVPTSDCSDDDNLDQIKILFVRNLDVTETVEQFTRFIQQFIDKQFIEKIFKFKDYAFVHLMTRKHAEELLGKLRDVYQGSFTEVSFASPPSKFTNKRFRKTLISNGSNYSSNVGCRQPVKSNENIPSTSSSMARRPFKSIANIPSTSSFPGNPSLREKLAEKNLEYIATKAELEIINKERRSLQNKLLSAAAGESLINVSKPSLCEEIANIPLQLLAAPRLDSITEETFQGEDLLFNDADFEEMVNDLVN